MFPILFIGKRLFGILPSCRGTPPNRRPFARHVGVGLLGMAMFTGAAGAGVAVPQYTLTDLGALPGTNSSAAAAINNSGQVVGSSGPSQSSEPFLYGKGSMQQIGNLSGGATANGINNLGQVVGYSPATQQSFLYSGGTLTYISGMRMAMGINDSGQIAGNYSLSSQTPFLYAAGIDSNGLITKIDGPAPNFDTANAINASGQVAGWGVFGPPTSAFLYSNGTVQLIQTPTGYQSDAIGINNLGQVVGYSNFGHFSNGRNPVEAFLYSNGVAQDLGTLGGAGSQALGINDAGEVVGESDVSSSTHEHGFLDVNGTMYDLNDLTIGESGYLITSAVGINSSGQIAANAITPSGQEHAVLLSPSSIPLPPAAWAAVSALPLLFFGRRFRRMFR
jgi:probable HAF family extracellular repeat protein